MPTQTPKRGRLVRTQLNGHLGLVVRVDTKPNKNLAVRYFDLKTLRLAWTTWYIRGFRK